MTIHYDATLILLLPLLALLFSTLGVAFGLLVESVEIAQSTTYALLFVLVLAAPVFIPWESLPVPLQIFALALPFTYAADALRMSLTGQSAAHSGSTLACCWRCWSQHSFCWSGSCAGVWNSIKRADTPILCQMRKTIQPIQQNVVDPAGVSECPSVQGSSPTRTASQSHTMR